MNTTYLVDGSGYIFRAYYAVAPLSNSQGLPTNALLGFSRMIMKLIKDKQASSIAVAFDTGKPTFRHEIYSEYKANRDECPEDLVPQMPYFRKIAKALGLVCYEKEGFEADDIIATLTVNLASEDNKVVIVSGDKDLTQLVNDNVVVWDAMRDINYNDQAVIDKFGVKPEQIRDYLSLIGDTSDNIPGVRGVGPKTAQRLIQEFGDIDKMIKNVDKIKDIEKLRGAKGVQAKIEGSIEQMRLSQSLIDLDYKVKPFNKVKDYNELTWEGPIHDELEILFNELEFNSILSKVNSVFKNSKKELKDKEYKVLEKKDLKDLAKQIKAKGSFAFDTETSSLDPLSCHLIGVSFSLEEDKAYFVGFSSFDPSASLVDLEDFKKVFSKIFADKEIKKFGANIKFDIEVLEAKGIEVEGVDFDTMLAAHVLSPDKRDYGLKSLAYKHLGESMLTYDELVKNAESKASSLLELPFSRLSKYACHDADATLKVRNALKKELDKEEFSTALSLFTEIEMPLVPVLADIETAGIKIDTDYLDGLSKEFGTELEDLTKRIYAVVGEEFNINSPKQLSEVLFDKLGISTKGIKKNKTAYSTNSVTLEKLKGQHEIVDLILSYRAYYKLKSTYVDALPPLVSEETKRLHASFNQAITATGRLSSSNPNLQNIPIKSKNGRRIRNAFCAKEDSTFIIADYSQIELRILAHLSEDEALTRAFVTGEDIHSKTAQELFGADLFADKKELRRIAKTINFGIIYGMGAFRLARELEISRDQAQEYIDKYFARYPSVLDYFDRLRSDMDILGYVETLFGRRRYKQDIDSSGRDYGYSERSLLNAPIQGTAAEIIKKAMINLNQSLAKYSQNARMVLQVHDELIIETSKKLAEPVFALVVREMENAVKLSVPLKVEARVSQRWGGE